MSQIKIKLAVKTHTALKTDIKNQTVKKCYLREEIGLLGLLIAKTHFKALNQTKVSLFAAKM